MITTVALSAATASVCGGWFTTSMSSVTSVAATFGIENVPSAAVVVVSSVPCTLTVAPATGLLLPSSTTPPTVRVATGVGGGGLTSVSCSDSAVFAASSVT